MEDRRLPHYLPGVKTGARVGNLKLDLPVDEDDYLMPSPQSTQPHHAGYMDLIGDAKLGGKIPARQISNYLWSSFENF